MYKTWQSALPPETPASIPIAAHYRTCWKKPFRIFRPQTVQELLEQCTSVKVKRLFLYLAEKAGHEWAKYLDLSKVDLGKGKRALVKGGEYVTKYQMTVPKEWSTPIPQTPMAR